MSKKELAAQYHASGCNCAMAVGCAFCDKAGVSEDEMKAHTNTAARFWALLPR